MKIYHGTREGLLAKILEQGIRPRGRRKGNWKDYPSRSDMVYLTTSYAPYFAISGIKKKDERALVLEIDLDTLDELKMYPDEDFISQAISMKSGEPLDLVHHEVRENLEDYRHHHRDSIEGLGNMSYRGTIPPGSITAYCLLDPALRPDLLSLCMDPSISIMNYRFCGNKYRSVIEWMFGRREDFDVGGPIDNESYFKMIGQVDPACRERCLEIFRNRRGIELHKIDHGPIGSPGRKRDHAGI